MHAHPHSSVNGDESCSLTLFQQTGSKATFRISLPGISLSLRSSLSGGGGWRTPLPLFVAFIINAEKKFCQEAANTFSIYSHKKTASKRSCVHLSTLKLSWRTSTPAEDHVEEVSSFLLRRKNDDRWYRSGVSTQPFNLLFRIRGYWPSEYHILWYSIKKCPLESSRHLRRPLRIE